MARRDIYHQLVKEALIAEGWQITHDPYVFETDPQLATDLGAERVIGATRDHEKIAVEVKSFLAESQVADLEKALGQYGLYRRLLQLQEPNRILYLAVPAYAFENIFQKPVGRLAIDEFKLKLIVFGSEGTLQWNK